MEQLNNVEEYEDKDYELVSAKDGFYSFRQIGHPNVVETFDMYTLSALIDYGFVEGVAFSEPSLHTLMTYECLSNSYFLKYARIKFKKFVNTNLFELYDTKVGYLLANRIRKILELNGVENSADSEYLVSINYGGFIYTPFCWLRYFYDVYYKNFEDALSRYDLLFTTKSVLKNYFGLDDDEIKDIESHLGISFKSEYQGPHM